MKNRTLLLICLGVTLFCVLLLVTGFFGLRRNGEDSGSVPAAASYENSPEQRAILEWMDYCRTYDPESRMLAEADPSTLEAPYSFYGACTPDMVKELDSLAEKFGLRLHQSLLFCGTAQELYEAAGLSPFLPEGTEAFGYLFEDGSFHLESTTPLSGGLINGYSMDCHRPGAFPESLLSRAAAEEGQHWDYTAPDGTALLLWLGRDSSRICTDLPQAYVTLTVPAGGATDEETPGLLSAAGLEALAGAISWSALN